jgi:hypothetical protein
VIRLWENKKLFAVQQHEFSSFILARKGIHGGVSALLGGLVSSLLHGGTHAGVSAFLQWSCFIISLDGGLRAV